LRGNCSLKHVIEGIDVGRLEIMGRQRIRLKQLLDDLNEKRGSWILKKKALDRNLREIRFGRGYGLVRQTTGWMNKL
jgi:hypothetical protein